MTTMTNFSAIAERIGKTTSEKKAVEAMANALGSVENAIADGDTVYTADDWIDDEGYCGYPTARVNGFAIVMCCDDDDSLAIQVFDEEDDHAIECGEIYQQLSGFDSFDDMQLAAEYLAFTLCHVR